MSRNTWRIVLVALLAALPWVADAETIWAPRRWLEARYNITRWTVMPRGGHFAAFEQPDLLVDDVRAFFGRCGSACATKQSEAGDDRRGEHESR